MSSDSGYKFLVYTENDDEGRPVLNFTEQNMKIWKKVVLTDNIFDMFSYAEITLADYTGLISDLIISIEGLKFETKMGNEEDGFIESTYVGLENQLVEATISDHVSGDVVLSLNTYYKVLDFIRSYAWEDTISNVVTDIVTNVFGVPLEKQFIEPTTGTDVRYQINKTSEDFIESLADRAYSQNNPDSPYLTFFNCNGEFYFKSINKLFEEDSINLNNPYIISSEEGNQIDSYTLKDLTTQQAGLEVNQINYKRKFFVNKPDNSVESEDDDILDHIAKGDGSLLIRKDLKPLLNSSYENFGIYENTDFENYKGWKNSFFKNSALSMRMEGIISYNSSVMAGKVINLEIGSSILEKSGFSNEYSGKWLIIESRLFYDVDEIVYQKVTLAKSRIKTDPNHPFRKKNLK